MKSILSLFLCCSLVLNSFKTTEPPLVTISGILIDFQTGKAVSEIEFLLLSAPSFHSEERYLTSELVSTDSHGLFSAAMHLVNSDYSFELISNRFADIKFINAQGLNQISLGRTLAVSYDNEVKVENLDSLYKCPSVPPIIRGESLHKIIMNWNEQITKMTPNPIDTVKIGSSAKGVGEPQCWYEHKVLSFTRDLSKG